MSEFFIVMSTVESKKISIKDQGEHHSNVGMLLYLVKHLHPDITNLTRELLKANNGANPAAFKELLEDRTNR